MIGHRTFGESTLIQGDSSRSTQSISFAVADVPRQQALRKQEEDKLKANHRFARQIKDIISRVCPIDIFFCHLGESD